MEDSDKVNVNFYRIRILGMIVNSLYVYQYSFSPNTFESYFSYIKIRSTSAHIVFYINTFNLYHSIQSLARLYGPYTS